MKNENEQIRQQVAEKFMKLNKEQKEFAVGYMTGKRDEKQAGN